MHGRHRSCTLDVATKQYRTILKLIFYAPVLDPQQLNLEHERRRRRDDGRVATSAITEVRWDRKLAFLADTRSKDPLIPSLDDLSYADCAKSAVFSAQDNEKHVRVNSNGWLRSSDESNFDPSEARVPV